MSLNPTPNEGNLFQGGHPQKYRPQYSGSGQNYHGEKRRLPKRKLPKAKTLSNGLATENKK